MSLFMDAAMEETELLKDSGIHWMCKGRRSIAAAATLLRQDKIIAIPTDTIYGLAGIVSNTSSIKKLYEIKGRDERKPLSISVAGVNNVKDWGIVDHIPPKLLVTILPGPCTLILKRTPALNPAFNPNHDTVGIRVPNFKFINCVADIVGPLALTSANISDQPSCLYASEFENLWPLLGGVFHDSDRFGKAKKGSRKGSTIVDLTVPHRYKIVRSGIGAKFIIQMLEYYGLKRDSD